MSSIQSPNIRLAYSRSHSYRCSLRCSLVCSPRCILCSLVCNLRCSKCSLVCRPDTYYSPCSRNINLCSQVTNLCTRACSQVCIRTHISPVLTRLRRNHRLLCLNKVSHKYVDPSRWNLSGQWQLSASTANTTDILKLDWSTDSECGSGLS